MKLTGCKLIQSFILIVLSVSSVSNCYAKFTEIFGSFYDEPSIIGENHPASRFQHTSLIETLYGEHNVRRISDSLDDAFMLTEEFATIKTLALFTSGSANLDAYRINKLEPQVTKTEKVPFNIWIRSGANDGYNIENGLEDTIQKSDVPDLFELRLFNFGEASSIPNRNLENTDLMVTFEIVANEGFPDNPIGSYVIAWEGETRVYRSDFDYQDVVFELSGAIPVGIIPEPTGLLLMLSALVTRCCRWRGAV